MTVGAVTSAIRLVAVRAKSSTSASMIEPAPASSAMKRKRTVAVRSTASPTANVFCTQARSEVLVASRSTQLVPSSVTCTRQTSVPGEEPVSFVYQRQ